MKEKDVIKTASLPGQVATGEQGLQLLVFSGSTVRTVALPAEGVITLGRSTSVDVSIEDAGVSRQHAELRLGPTLELRDLGSANGTRLRQNQLEPDRPVVVRPGDAIEIGSTVVLIQAQVAVPAGGRVPLPADAFRALLERECRQHEGGEDGFALVRLRLDVSPSPRVVEQVLRGVLRDADAFGIHGQGYDLLVLDVGPEEVQQVVRQATGDLAAEGASVRAAVACYPVDGTTATSLLATVHARLDPHDEQTPMVIADAAMERLHRLIERVAPSDISVLLLGETGVGKELFAQSLHQRSRRAGKPLVTLNCAAFSETLLESELFGHERGAFTGAVKAKPGLFEAARGGTVFLDEVGELPLSIQAKLLRVLETRQVRKVGGLESVQVDVRFISATNRDLEAEVASRAFREDLYFRLNGISVSIPPLRERIAEVEGLARLFIEQASRAEGRRPLTLSADALRVLREYPWPGNIRELRNVMERAVLLCDGEAISTEHLPMEKMKPARGPLAGAASPSPSAPTPAPDRPASAEAPAVSSAEIPALQEALADAERRQILEALERCAGNQTRAAKLLGISRRTLISRLERYGIPRPRAGRD